MDGGSETEGKCFQRVPVQLCQCGMALVVPVSGYFWRWLCCTCGFLCPFSRLSSMDVPAGYQTGREALDLGIIVCLYSKFQ